MICDPSTRQLGAMIKCQWTKRLPINYPEEHQRSPPPSHCTPLSSYSLPTIYSSLRSSPLLPRPQRRGEVVVFNPPSTFRDIVTFSSANSAEGAKKAKEALIKRVVAVEGDDVQVKRGSLFINGQEQDEPWTNEKAAYDFGPVKVPPGQLLVLGDNRNHR